ncbi:hypothetical protein BCU45_022450 [Vibrio lentus]|uniref:hypothetical protein n=1 Tax=Vibrio lentus TaxID=136468 RepID=UPI000C85B769|nr:hypothetical protein [Vibrio lentus]PMI41429.1 hypothetical protein BCU45_19390 [Vibrio lentus]PMJ56413.1 hypothetical protein BCU20_20595 [Vibrio lentus]
MIKNKLYSYYFDKIIDDSATKRIPRSGERARTVNCFVVALDIQDKPYFLATSFDKERTLLKGLLWNGQEYADSGEVEISDVDNYRLEITHYYGLSSVSYSNIYDLAFHRMFGVVYALVRIQRFYHERKWNSFYKKKFVTKNRMELLYLLAEHHMNSGVPLTQQQLMTKLYGPKWVFHPAQKGQQKKIEFYLSSLVNSNDVIKSEKKFQASPQALETIERHEEDERKFEESQALQAKLVLLTLLLAIFAAIQSGLIKLPPIIDLVG